jgi:hypothetical protein
MAGSGNFAPSGQEKGAPGARKSMQPGNPVEKISKDWLCLKVEQSLQPHM